MKRISLLLLSAALLSAGEPPRRSAPAPSIRLGEQGTLAHTADEQGNRIVDFSHAGYGGGGVAIPHVPVKIVVEAGGGRDRDRIQAALDLGLPGLVSYLAIWIISAGLLWRTWQSLNQRGATRHPYYALVAGVSGSLVAGWVFGIFDAIALGSRPGFLWWMLLGFAASVHYAVLYSGERLRSRRHASVSLSLPLRNRRPRPAATIEPSGRS